MDASPNSEKSELVPVILLGLGFTTRRLARRLLARGTPVYAVIRQPERFLDLASLGLRLSGAPGEGILVHTVPPLPDVEMAALHDQILGLRPRRVLYISSTGVYGRQLIVTAETAVDPFTAKGGDRIAEETWIQRGPWQSLILRPAAIYGPGRGVHVRIGRGESPRAAGPGVVSRIHVDDLAGILEASIASGVQGAWPVADDHPCSSDEINEFCARLQRISIKNGTEAAQSGGRRVDGTAIRALLRVALSYPTYESGILASLAEAGC